MKRLSVEAIQRLRSHQAMWRAIAEDLRIRASARENAARHVATIEAQIVANRAHVVLGAASREVRHG